MTGTTCYTVSGVIAIIVCFLGFYVLTPSEKLDEELALRKVIEPTQPIITGLGEDALLPCHLFLEMDVDWIRSQFSNIIYMFWDGKDQQQKQLAEHRRTVFTNDTIINGSIDFKIRNIKISDDGQYQCYFEKKQVFQRAIVEIIVATRTRNRRSSIVLWILVVLLICFMVRNYLKKEEEDTGNSHVCQREYYQGKTLDWEQNQVIKESLAKEKESLFKEKESLVKEKESLVKEKESLVKEKESLFKEKESLVKEKESLAKERESLCMERESLGNERQSLATVKETLYTLRESLNKENMTNRQEEKKDSEYLRKSEFLTKEREQLAKEKDSYKKREFLTTERECLNKEREKDSLDPDKVSLIRERESLNTERSLKKKTKSLGKGKPFVTSKEEIPEDKFQVALQEEIDWRKANIYADWRKEQFQALHMTLDPDTAHPELILSEEWRWVIRGESPQNFSDTSKRFDSLPCVLGREKITSGRHYWELEVGTRADWDLGVCRDDVKKKGMITVSPENGFWALRLCNNEYWALTSPPTSLSLRQSPHKVAVFLDYDAGDVSFYNMNDGSHIYNFTSVSFNGTLYPFIRLWSYDQTPVTICIEP
ncbi:butyrophilin subfamily 2 member A1-like isoform X2 [Macrotis lagotis]|uniref:butyrophilin subfamily 2 member A1-like isoform X2 n=1 Tax=Macrotis lagotis TaxID=92651 RepID=UPI003D6964DD